MKKTFVLLVFSIVLIIQHATSSTQFSQTTKDIPLKKEDVQTPPRRLPLESFTASYDSETLAIVSPEYTGNVQVQIIGVDGFSYSYYSTSTYSEYIDISILPQGNYFLRITTESGSIYTGEFEL